MQAYLPRSAIDTVKTVAEVSRLSGLLPHTIELKLGARRGPTRRALAECVTKEEAQENGYLTPQQISEVEETDPGDGCLYYTITVSFGGTFYMCAEFFDITDTKFQDSGDWAELCADAHLLRLPAASCLLPPAS